VVETRRGEVGLSDPAFVFCCFNSPYKIHPATFAIWMRILSAIPWSVLWLIEEDARGKVNLRSAAASAGVDPDRLIFAPRMPYAKHLSRLSHADLFIDTFPCTAHTTASDALWAGVPVLTRMGRSFASRVAASLLSALGLEELITSTPQQFEELAIELARSPARIAQLRQRLDVARQTSALFDGKRFCRNLEAAFELMTQRHRRGVAPAPIDLSSP
jgi:predicted O-linked N-acetylglucosamine transferase (SPINDLY family)